MGKVVCIGQYKNSLKFDELVGKIVKLSDQGCGYVKQLGLQFVEPNTERRYFFTYIKIQGYKNNPLSELKEFSSAGLTLDCPVIFKINSILAVEYIRPVPPSLLNILNVALYRPL